MLFGNITGRMVLSMTKTAWIMTVTHAVLTGVVANILFQCGMRYVGGATASLLSMFEPVTCVAVGIILLGETITPVKLFGCAMIMSGILVVAWEEHRKK